ncbi:MAG TPA: lmo0937 family membrane protein [Bradyrhizobium sp.]|nr:lmo0937 family membrane protein [Bradyrhizobium sp.]HKS20672.1 lmo0937 family membrane protein [Bradyrhizobium sp.]
MLATIGIILIVLWLLGLLVFKSLGAIVHIALVVGVILIVLNFIRGRNAV